MRIIAIQCLGRNQGCRNFHQFAIAYCTKEAIAAAGMAGDTLLMYEQQQSVAVAVNPQLPQVLHLT